MKNQIVIDGEIAVIFMDWYDAIVATLIDTADLPLIAHIEGPWHVRTSSSSLFAVAWVPPSETEPGHEVLLHRLIADCPSGAQVRHKNHRSLDNRRCNLEIRGVATGNTAA